MFSFLMIAFWVLIGMFIGWNVSQPDWAKALQQRALGLFLGSTDKTDTNHSDSHHH